MKHNSTDHSRTPQTTLVLIAALLLACTSVVAPGAAHATAGTCSGVDPLSGEALQVVGARKLYSNGERRFHHVPTGAAISLRPTAGMTEADLHSLLSCRVGNADPASPLGVEGVKVRVERSGELYVVHITSSSRAAALEVQHRAAAAVQR